VSDADYNYGMSKEQQIAIWMSMMMTATMKRFGLSRSEFVPIAIKYGIISFLINQYELFHYYDKDYIVDDVVKHISEQGGELRELSGTA
jgi:hypothetical protein